MCSAQVVDNTTYDISSEDWIVFHISCLTRESYCKFNLARILCPSSLILPWVWRFAGVVKWLLAKKPYCDTRPLDTSCIQAKGKETATATIIY